MISNGRGDTSRLLAAGAVEVLWLRVAQGTLAEAMPALEQRLAASDHVLIESNSIVEFLRPDVYVSLLDERVEDFKASARRLLPRANAVAAGRRRTRRRGAAALSRRAAGLLLARIGLPRQEPTSLHISPRGERKCVRGLSDRGAPLFIV